jgi:hypothetical protein
MPILPPDVLRLVFDQFEHDATSILNVSLTCHAWHSLSMPTIYRNVDLSYHNIGDREVFDLDGGNEDDNEAAQRYVNGQDVYTDFRASVRPLNLVHRQRAFLRTIIAHPELAKHVKSLTWTLVWKDRADSGLTEIDRQTWNVFRQLNNVTKLDLASLHNIHDDDFVRQNPSQLFPAVVDLKLVGWMHRGLVKAIFATINTARLHSLTLDYAQDEGALPDGSPMSEKFADRCSSKLAKTMGEPAVVSQTLLDRQESGKAFIFPGPMWLPLHILSTARLDSLTHLRVDIPPFSFLVNQQNYVTLFRKTADLIGAASASLRSLVIILENPRGLPDSAGIKCGTGYMQLWEVYRPWCLKMSLSYLHQLATVLSEHPFPLLEHVTFEGFDQVEHASDALTQARDIERAFDPIQAASVESAQAADLEHTLEAVRNCPFDAAASLTGIPSTNERPIFNGYINQAFPRRFDEWEENFEDMLNASFEAAAGDSPLSSQVGY